MASKNEITGDSIISKSISAQYLNNYDAIFRKKPILVLESEQQKDIMQKVYFGNWDCYFDMVRDFSDFSMTKSEYDNWDEFDSVLTNISREWGKSKHERATVALNDPQYKTAEILFAVYDQEGYEGSAFVLFKRENRLYEVNGSHCSCYGLEGQWEPEETTVEALLKRDRFAYTREYNSDILQVIKRIEQDTTILKME